MQNVSSRKHQIPRSRTLAQPTRIFHRPSPSPQAATALCFELWFEPRLKMVRNPQLFSRWVEGDEFEVLKFILFFFFYREEKEKKMFVKTHYLFAHPLWTFSLHCENAQSAETMLSTYIAQDEPTITKAHTDAWAELWSSGIEVEGNLTVAASVNSSLYYILRFGRWLIYFVQKKKKKSRCPLLLFVCLLFVVCCCLLFVVCCLLFVVCCLFPAHSYTNIVHIMLSAPCETTGPTARRLGALLEMITTVTR